MKSWRDFMDALKPIALAYDLKLHRQNDLRIAIKIKESIDIQFITLMKELQIK